jgi:hypothetical protein
MLEVGGKLSLSPELSLSQNLLVKGCPNLCFELWCWFESLPLVKGSFAVAFFAHVFRPRFPQFIKLLRVLVTRAFLSFLPSFRLCVHFTRRARVILAWRTRGARVVTLVFTGDYLVSLINRR